MGPTLELELLLEQLPNRPDVLVCLTDGQKIQWCEVERSFSDDGKPSYKYRIEPERDDVKDMFIRYWTCSQN